MCREQHYGLPGIRSLERNQLLAGRILRISHTIPRATDNRSYPPLERDVCRPSTILRGVRRACALDPPITSGLQVTPQASIAGRTGLSRSRTLRATEAVRIEWRHVVTYAPPRWSIVFAIRQTHPRSSAPRSIVAARRPPSTGADRNRLHHDHDFRRKTIAGCQHLADIPALSGRSPSHAISIIRSVRIDRSQHTPAVWLALPRTAALRTSANCRPTRGPSVRATSRIIQPTQTRNRRSNRRNKPTAP